MDCNVFKTEIGGREVTVETGKYAGQANGSCIIRCGDTVVMTNVTMADAPRPGMDYFPLGVDFEEKLYAIGKIPGSFKRREGRGSDKAILTSRLIDRPIRPLFPKGLFNDVSVVATALSVDTNIPPEVFGMLGSSIALSISDIPFMGPTGSVVVGCVDGKYIINPDNEQRAKSNMHVYVSGTKDAIMMVEAGASEVSEEEMLGGIMFAHEEIKKQVKFINDIVAKVGKPKLEMELYHIGEDVDKAVRKYADKKLDKALDTFDRAERQANQDEVQADVMEHFKEEFEGREREIGDSLYYLTKEKVREKILSKGIRPDGRKTTDIRDIWCEVGVLPRTHGSAVFTRGQSQALSICTLGTARDAQKLDNLDDEETKRYMHQYNMPPYSTGEAKPLRAPGRREIGHGALAERALEPVIPSEDVFPYTIRVVSEILSSNGSTSQASVCGSTLSLMDAGVPIKAPVAGIAMGLIKDEAKNRLAILSDIQGLEDFLGDMDFKVAGTEKGITAIQMDIKIKGIDENILRTALEQARVGRLHILGKMLAVLDKPRPELSQYAPKIIMFNIDPEKIGDVIGKSGKTINKIVDDTGVKIDIEEDGRVFIAGVDPVMTEKAKEIILSIVKDPEIGDVYEGPVVTVRDDLGAFVELAPGRDGMIHIAKLGKFVGKRLDSVSAVLKEGDTVKVEVVSFTKQGKIDLKLLEKLTGDPIEKAPEGEWQEDRPARGERRPRPDRPSRPRRDRGEKSDKGDK
ncbi:polyribonucleotide nucleotidyltransferase [Anaerocaecibacter muris]|uniref:polyribonucleotide nucleotidyltransferase n=1 Tax=Anaerocaecibacter muris TaxID=2941513 RepID=UPI00203F0484|nr:polyribonucleotide nucleotidyltransferase [Anaerocaecibacter muris]